MYYHKRIIFLNKTEISIQAMIFLITYIGKTQKNIQFVNVAIQVNPQYSLDGYLLHCLENTDLSE